MASLPAPHAYTISVWDILGALWAGALVLGWVGDRWRRARLNASRAAELRHQRRVELALARSGQRYRRPGELAGDEYVPPAATGPGLADGECAPPAATIPLPPSAYPLTVTPGSCRHEKIVPVITLDGELRRWMCANPRCTAEFDKSVAIYEEAGS